MGQMWEMLGEGLVHHAVLWASVTTVLRDQGELATSGPAHTWEGNAIEQQFYRYLEIRLKGRQRTSTRFIHRSNKYVVPQICGPDGRDSNLQFIPHVHSLGIVQIVDGEPSGSSNKHIVLGNSHTIWYVAELGEQQQQQQKNTHTRKKGMIFSCHRL